MPAARAILRIDSSSYACCANSSTPSPQELAPALVDLQTPSRVPSAMPPP